LLAENPEYDVAFVLSDPETLEPQSVVFLAERETWVHENECLPNTADGFEESLAGRRGDVSGGGDELGDVGEGRVAKR
jgi:hypothetical protein